MVVAEVHPAIVIRKTRAGPVTTLALRKGMRGWPQAVQDRTSVSGVPGWCYRQLRPTQSNEFLQTRSESLHKEDGKIQKGRDHNPFLLSH